jgi:hypothetical protein
VGRVLKAYPGAGPARPRACTMEANAKTGCGGADRLSAPNTTAAAAKRATGSLAIPAPSKPRQRRPPRPCGPAERDGSWRQVASGYHEPEADNIVKYASLPWGWT